MAGVERGRGVLQMMWMQNLTGCRGGKMALRNDGLVVGSKSDKPRFWKGGGNGHGNKAMLLHHPGWNLSIFRRPTPAMSEA